MRIAVYLGSLDGRPATTAQIAAATIIPQQYLAKILRNMARGGLVQSQRGLGGGSTLARPPEEMTIYDVIHVVDPIRRIRVCPLGLKTHSVRMCPLHYKLDQVMALAENAYRETTIAMLVADPNRPSPLVESIPTTPASGLVSARIIRRGAAATSAGN